MGYSIMSNLLSYDPKHALNAICPYFTMFPLEYPMRVLKKHKPNNPVVFDPFCGRGTTIYAARDLGLKSWGFDTSPIAVAIAKAKLASAKVEDVIKLAEQFIGIEPKHVPDTPFFNKAYAPSTLKQICSIREGLLRVRKERSATVLLRALSLGCLHGPLNKSIETAGYFSNQMPRTFSTKPDYSVKYWEKNKLNPPDVNVIDVLKRKLSRIQDLDKEVDGTPEQVICTNSCLTASYKTLPKDIGVVVTSPPYYGMSTYVQDQWLRMWFLGGPEAIDYRNENQIKHGSVDSFIKDLSRVWTNIHKSTSDSLDMYIRFGSLPSTNADAKYILQSSIEDATGWRIIYTKNASDSRSGKRQADQMAPNSNPEDEYDFHVIRV
jgi:hypothetical protein